MTNFNRVRPSTKLYAKFHFKISLKLRTVVGFKVTWMDRHHFICDSASDPSRSVYFKGVSANYFCILQASGQTMVYSIIKKDR